MLFVFKFILFILNEKQFKLTIIFIFVILSVKKQLMSCFCDLLFSTYRIVHLVKKNPSYGKFNLYIFNID